jgi:hypothetical protein
MKTIGSLTLAIALLVSMSSQANDCGYSHCSKKSDILNTRCVNDGKAGQPVYFEDKDGRYCSCPCSCFTADSKIGVGGGELAVKHLFEGYPVNTENGRTPIQKLMMSHVKDVPAIEVKLSNGRSTRVSDNHPFIQHDGVVVSAEDLRVGTRLRGVEGSEVSVTELKPFVYSGTFYNFIMDAGPKEKRSEKDRVLHTAGAQTGDWMVQSYRDYADASVALRVLIQKMNEKK